MQVFTPSHVANFIIDRAKKERLNITQVKLLKLVYLSYGWVRAVLDRRLFDEPIQACKLGPVVPSLYHEFKRFKSSPVTEFSIYMDENGGFSEPHIPTSDQSVKVIQKAWDVYKPFTASALVNKTYEPDSPWAKYYDQPEKNVIIPDEEIKAYFAKKIREYIEAAQ